MLLSCAAAGCAASPDTARWAERDSAGIAIVENRGAASAQPTRWQVESRPQLTIGTEEGAEPYRFSGITGVLRAAGSRIIVADRSNTIRFYDSSGRFESAHGRQGDGPGEFNTISLLRRYGADSLIAWDFALRRATILSADGSFGRIVPGPGVAGFYFVVDAFSDGALVGLMEGGVDLSHARPGVLRTPSHYLRFDPRSTDADTIPCPSGAQSYVHGGSHPTLVGVPFSPAPVAVAAAREFYCGSAESYEIRKYNDRGALLRILRLARPNRPLTPGIRHAFMQRLLDGARTDAGRRAIEARYAGVPFPSTLPAYQAFLVDAGGDLWVQDYAADDAEALDWTVFAPSGRLLGRARTPAGFAVYDIGPDYLLGVATDSLDVERVEVLTLRRGS